jgi:hypothetical protein
MDVWMMFAVMGAVILLLNLISGSCGHTMWLLFQGSIAFAVFASDFEWRWSDNPYFTAGVAFAAAFFATVVTNRLRNLIEGEPFGQVHD